MEPVDVYLATRQRILALLDDHPGAESVDVAGTPGWTVHDVVAHLTGAAADVTGGRLEGAGSPPWTQRQVDDRRGRSLDDIVAEWEAELPAFTAGMRERPFPPLVFDVIVHEHDLRSALGLHGPSDDDAVDWCIQPAVAGVGRRLEQAGVPALRIVSGETEWTVGPGEPGASVDVDRHELLRALFGRRSSAQVRRWSWDGDPNPYLDHLSVFGPLPADDVIEASA